MLPRRAGVTYRPDHHTSSNVQLRDECTRQAGLLAPDSSSASCIRGHQSEIMFGVLVLVLGRDPIARPEFSLGQRQVPVIVSSRVVRPKWIWAGRTRCPPLRAPSRYPSQSRLTRIYVCLSAILHGSLREIGR
jgi:hypothetical protein